MLSISLVIMIFLMDYKDVSFDDAMCALFLIFLTFTF